MRWISKILKDEEAATLVEYSIMLALMITVMLATINAVGIQGEATWDTIETSIVAAFQAAGVAN